MIRMAMVALAGCLAAFAAQGATTVTDLSVQGEIEGENIVFVLSMNVETGEGEVSLPLVVGDVAYMDSKLPRRAEVVREGDRYLMKIPAEKRSFWSFGQPRTQKEAVTFRFASRPVRDGEWRRTGFSIPSASIRKVGVLCDREDLEIRFPGALDVQRAKAEKGRVQVTAFLGLAERFEVAWKPEVRKLDSELVVSCEANTIATAGVGALRVDNLFTYRVIQGQMTKLSFLLPDVNVTQVHGEDIQDWRVERVPGKPARLAVALSRPKDGVYRLRVESEANLPKFPCRFNFPVVTPEQVLRASGFLMIGADSAIKLNVNKAGGMTQVDQAGFPTVAMEGKNQAKRPAPMRSVYAYQFAAMPYVLDLGADDIVTALSAESMVSLSIEDRDLVFRAQVQIDVRDAPAREIVFETDADPAWTVTAVTGKQVAEADMDVRDEGGVRRILVPFKQAVSGAVLVDIRMERTMGPDATAFVSPAMRVAGAKSERGYIVVAAEKGIRLRPDKVEGLRDVHTGSVPMRVPGAQQAFRFKEPGWKLAMSLERTIPALHAEVFHLMSLGDGVLYYSATITYHIGGAPLQEFTVRVPSGVETVEFTGADVEGWTRTNDLCRIRLQKRVLGDYTLLVTYDRQFDYEKADIGVGGVETAGAESEVGYIALASQASLRLSTPQPLPGAMIEIDRDEIPKGYSAPVKDPILKAFKYVRNPHAVALRVERLDTERLLGQIADYVWLDTTVSRDGEAVTTARYFIKNATRQYLVVRLPENVKLWSIRYVEENGVRRNATSQQSGNGILVPVARPRDPNTAIQVEVVYAQSHRKLGFWRTGLSGLSLAMPVLPETHAAFSDWRIAVPEKFAIAGVTGPMDPPADARSTGLRMVGVRIAAVWRELFGYCGRPWNVLTAEWREWRTIELTDTVRLSGSDAVPVNLRVMPSWIGGNVSIWLLVAGLAGGLAALILLWRSAFGIALGLTLLTVGMAETVLGRSVIVGMLYVEAMILILVGAGWAALWAISAFRRRLEARRAARTQASGEDDSGSLPFEPDRGPQSEPPAVPAAQAAAPAAAPVAAPGEGGSALVGWLALLAAAAIAPAVLAASARGDAKAATPPSSVPLMQSVQIDMDGPRLAREAEKSARVKTVLRFDARDAFALPVLTPDGVLTGFDLGGKDLKLEAGPAGYVLSGSRAGTYEVKVEYRVPVVERQGTWVASALLPANLRNRVTLRLPEAGMDVQSGAAVLFKVSETSQVTVAEAVFGPGSTASFTWAPRVRTVKLEQAVWFADVNTLATLQSGVIELASQVRFQIAQGELREFRILVPKAMSVTAVKGANLATWSFDPEKRVLDIVLERAVSGDYVLGISAQIGSDGLPYAAAIGALRADGASRQRGALAVAAAETVQVRIDEAKGANPINIEDFAPAEAMLGEMEPSRRAGVTLRRAWRYHDAEQVEVKVGAERVLPELRAVESGTLSIADERIVLATKIELAVAKAGVFSCELDVPAGFDVESLTGRDVSHWDDAKETGRGVVVHFRRQVADATEINLVVARTEKGIEQQIEVPRVGVRDVRKHTGRLTVSGERGVRMMVGAHAGVDLRKASEAGINQPGVLVFDILRPGWNVTLRTEVLAPQIKPEVLQWVDLAEGMLQCRAFVRYRIENAGAKTFVLQSPLPEASLTVSGRHIARVHQSDKAKGVWQVDLHGKVEHEYSMVVSYQVPYDPASMGVKIMPLRTVDTEPQRGYLVVTCAGRVQVEPRGNLDGLKAEDPRNVPSVFGAGDLSHAIQCYRTIRPEYALELSVVRHDAARVLPARINQVNLSSALSTDGKLLTRVVADLTVGNLRLLRVKLPQKGDRLWTVLVNGREVPTSRDGDRYCIPLEAQEGGGSSSVEFVYASDVAVSRFGSRHRLDAPSFDLPLTGIAWDLYVPPSMRCRKFEGTMEYMEESSGAVAWFNAGVYDDWNKQQRDANLSKARQVLDEAEKMVRSGQQQKAKVAYQQAYNYSQGEQGLNEDARVQLRNLVKEQVKLGLVTRRDAIRYAKNITEQPGQVSAGAFLDGNYDPGLAKQVEQQLSDADNGALNAVAEKLIDQQDAAAGVVSAISVTTPTHGRKLSFRRALQIDPSGELSIIFKTGGGRFASAWSTLWPAFLVLAAVWAIAARLGGAKTERA
jgi:hypothetical protein